MGDAVIGRRWIEAGDVGNAGARVLGHGVVEFEDDALGAVLTVGLLVVLFDDGEGIEDVDDVVARKAVKVEESGNGMWSRLIASARTKPAPRRAGEAG